MAPQKYSNAQVRTANLATIYLGGTAVGALQSVSFRDDYGLEPVTEIGNGNALENVPSIARHSISARQAVLFTGGLLATGAIPENMSAALKSMVFDITILDNVTGKGTRTYRKVSYSSGEMSVEANRVIVQSAEFMAIDVDGGVS